jgi:hypothetical protein
LTNYKYRDPDLSSEMTRFGWKVVSYSITTAWDIVLRVFVDLASPLLTGDLLSVKGQFDGTIFAEKLGPYKSTNATLPTSSLTSIVANPVTGSSGNAAATIGSETAVQSSVSKGPKPMPICRRWNKGACFGNSCDYRHICLHCKQDHPQAICPTQPTGYATPNPGYGFANQYNPQGYFPNMQQTFGSGQMSGGNQGFVGNQGYHGQQYQGQQAYPNANAYGPPNPGYAASAQNGQSSKARAYGPNQQAKGAQA